MGPSAAVKNYITSLPSPSSNHTERPCEDQPLVGTGQRGVLPSVTRALSLWLQLLSISGCLSGFAPGAHPLVFYLEGTDPEAVYNLFYFKNYIINIYPQHNAATAFSYVQTNITTCSLTHPPELNYSVSSSVFFFQFRLNHLKCFVYFSKF